MTKAQQTKLRSTRVIDSPGAKMLKKSTMVLWALMASAGISVATAIYLITPTIEVTNQASVEVKVTAHWKQKTKVMGTIAPGARRAFKVSDEAAMSFYVSYPDGREIITDGMYFTTTTTVTVIVRDSSVEVTASLVGAPELLGSTYVTTKGGAAHSN